jgi:site-specific recombinase XerD
LTLELAGYRRWAATDGRLSPRTIEKSTRYLEFLEQHGFNLSAPSLGREQILQLLAEARTSGIAPYTLNLWVTQLNRWLHFRGLEWTVPTFRHGHVADVPAPTRAQATLLWNLSWADPSTKARNRAILSTFLDKGLRRQEVIDLNLTDFVQTSKGPALVVRHGKGEKERSVPIARETAKRLRVYIDSYRVASDPHALFTSPRGRLSHAYLGKIVKTAGERVGLPWISCHKLRHFATDDMLDRGVSVQSAAVILGHENVETTMLYRTKRLSRQYAEDEVRAIDGARFRSERPEPPAPGTLPDERTTGGPPGAFPVTGALVDAAGSNRRGRRSWKSGLVGILPCWPGLLPPLDDESGPALSEA